MHELGPAQTARRTSVHGPSDVEPEINNVSVLDHVIFPFDAHLAGLFRPLLAAAGDVLFVGDDLGANEAALEVAVDLACARWGAMRLSTDPIL